MPLTSDINRQKQIDLSLNLAEVFGCKSVAFFIDGQMYLSKWRDDQWQTEKAMKDPDYKGNRYCWVPEVNKIENITA